MATLVKRVGGVWHVVYYDAAGKQKWVKGYTDKRETQGLAYRLEDEKRKILNGHSDPKSDARRLDRAKPVEEHIAEYKLALEAPGNSTNHISYTIADIKRFFDFSEVPHAEAVTRSDVDRWVKSLKDSEVDSLSTVNRRVGSVKAFLKALHQRGTLTEYVLYRYPKLKTLGHERRRRRALTPDEQRILIPKTPPLRREVYRFALLTGARYIQMATLTVGNVNFKEHTVVLQAKDNRHRNREQVIPLHPDLEADLRKRCKNKENTERVFPDLPAKHAAAKLIREDCAAAGVDTTDIDFHALRHSFITSLATANVHPKIVQQLAGHANIETTLKHYTHFRMPDERAALALLTL